MQDAGLVSVIVATYNMGQYVGEAIGSVLGQSYTNLEVHVVDDGSTDGTREIVEQIKDERLHYWWQENAGQASAKNLGISHSKGKFIAFCDADDVWSHDKLEVQIPAFEISSKIGVVYSRGVQIGEDQQAHQDVDADTATPAITSPALTYPSGWVTDRLFESNFVSFGTAVVKRECLDRLGAFDTRYKMGIDWELWLRLSLEYQFQFVDRSVFFYRVWPGQMSKDWRGRYYWTFQIMDNFINRYPKRFSKRAIAHAYAHCFVTRARLRSYRSGEHFAALLDAVRALRHEPDYPAAWKLFGRVGLNAIGIRRP